MSILYKYNQLCEQGLIKKDLVQLEVIKQLTLIHDALIHEHKRRRKFYAAIRPHKLIKGIYLWGSVGVGKTFLMDQFYAELPFQNKMRMHFHEFMKWVHSELMLKQGKKNPIQLIAKNLSKKTLILCLDELMVTDIVDAMILAKLFDALFSNGISLIVTSNIAPSDLYKNGLQRPLFLPAIELLKQHCTIFAIPTQEDYRLSFIKHAGVFYIPNDEVAKKNMEFHFKYLNPDKIIDSHPIKIAGREIQVKKKTSQCIWFDFKTICSPPRSQHDYIEIAERYHAVFVSDVTQIGEGAHNIISLLIRMIDVFYDRKIKLILSASVPIEQIYPKGKMHFEFLRVCSRLHEMQSEAYQQENSK